MKGETNVPPPLLGRRDLLGATRLSLIGPLEAGRLVSSLSGYVETLVVAGEPRDLLGNTMQKAREKYEQHETLGPLSEEWGGGKDVVGRVCQVRDPNCIIVRAIKNWIRHMGYNTREQRQKPLVSPLDEVGAAVLSQRTIDVLAPV